MRSDDPHSGTCKHVCLGNISPQLEEKFDGGVCLMWTKDIWFTANSTSSSMEQVNLNEQGRRFKNDTPVLFDWCFQPSATGEQKTKPTQNSVRELRGLGLSPDLVSHLLKGFWSFMVFSWINEAILHHGQFVNEALNWGLNLLVYYFLLLKQRRGKMSAKYIIICGTFWFLFHW